MTKFFHKKRVTYLFLLCFLYPGPAPCAAGPGYRIGDVISNFGALDEAGVPVSVHDYSGQVLVVHFCSLYCSPCRDYASDLPLSIGNLDVSVGPENYEILEVLLFGNQALPSTLSDSHAWTSFTGPGVTVMHADGDPDAPILQAFMNFDLDATPSFIVVDPALRIIDKDNSSGSAFDLVGSVEAALTAFSTPAPPVAHADLYAATPGLALNIDEAAGVLANDFEPNADAMEAMLVTSTTHGSLTLNADGSFVYDTPGGFTSDSFTYYAMAADGNSGNVTVTLDLGDAVIANDDFYDVPSDFPYELRSGLDGEFSEIWDNDFSSDGGALVIDEIAGADDIFIPADNTYTDTLHGQVRSNSSGRFVYQPDPGYRGPDSFQYRVRRVGGVATDTATVNLQVSERPTLSLATFELIPDELNVVMDALLLEALSFYWQFPETFYVAANPSGNPLTLYVVSPPTAGGLDFNPDGTFSYLPDPGFAGVQEESFWIQASDGSGVSDPQQVRLRPTTLVYARNDGYATGAKTTLVVPAGSGVLANDQDPDLDPIEVLGYGVEDLYAEAGQELGLPSGAALTIAADGSLNYVPPAPAGSPFSDLFFYDVVEVGGGLDGFSSAAVVINVDGVPNLPPLADAGGPYAVQTGASITLDAGGSSDPDLDALTYNWSAGAGSFDDSTAEAPLFTAPGIPGLVEITVTVDDGEGGTDSDTAEVIVFDEVPLNLIFSHGFELMPE